MFKCVLSCFKYIKASKRGSVKVDPQAAEKVSEDCFRFVMKRHGLDGKMPDDAYFCSFGGLRYG